MPTDPMPIFNPANASQDAEGNYVYDDGVNQYVFTFDAAEYSGFELALQPIRDAITGNANDYGGAAAEDKALLKRDQFGQAYSLWMNYLYLSMRQNFMETTYENPATVEGEVATLMNDLTG